MKVDTDGIKKNIKDNIQQIEDKAYSRGFEDGKEAMEKLKGYVNEEMAQKAYQKGLDDAWECARKMILSSVGDGGIESSEIIKIFGVREYYVLKDFSASEAIAKIKEYEEQQKVEDEIKVGDEVTAEDGAATFIVTFIGKNISGIDIAGNIYVFCPNEIDGKTGRHFPQIAEVLEQMKEGEG